MESYVETGYTEAGYIEGDATDEVTNGVLEYAFTDEAILKEIELTEDVKSIIFKYLDWSPNNDKDIEIFLKDEAGNLLAYSDEAGTKASYINGAWEEISLEDGAEKLFILRGDFLGKVTVGFAKYGFTEDDIGLVDDFTGRVEIITNYDVSLATNKKINFIDDSKSMNNENLKELLESKYGTGYSDEVNIVFGDSLKICKKIGDEIVIKEIASSEAGISAEDLKRITDLESNFMSESAIISTRVADAILEITSDENFLTTVAEKVLARTSVTLVAMNGDEITSSLVFNEATDSYTLDYDTSLLDGTDYTIQLKLG